MQIKYQYLKWLAPLALSINVLGLTGCSEPMVIPESGMNTLDVYQQHVGTADMPVKMYREVLNNRRDLYGYTRNSSNEIEGLFPKLPNPELVLYVFPHLSGKNRPIPGYATQFSMYEKDEYALPGEIAP